MQEMGVKALERLMNMPRPLPKRPAPSSVMVPFLDVLKYDRRPTRSHVTEDLFNANHNQGVSFLRYISPPNIRNTQVLNCIMFCGEKEWSDDETLVGMFGFPGPITNKCGLKRPDHLDPDYPGFHPGDNGKYSLVICPMAGITHPHFDGILQSQAFAHFYGQKLWLFWPPTEANLKAYMRQRCSERSEHLVFDAIDELEGLEVLWVDDEELLIWEMAPGTIHAVITFSRAAGHGSFFHVSRPFISHAQANFRAILNVVNGLDEGPNSTNDAVETVDDILHNISTSGLPEWSNLAAKMKTAKFPQRETQELERWIKEAQREANHVIEGRHWMNREVQREVVGEGMIKKRKTASAQRKMGETSAAKRRRKVSCVLYHFLRCIFHVQNP